MGHVRSNIGGIYENDKTYEQKGAVYTHVAKAKQQEALRFISAQAFATPTWMLDKTVLNKFDQAGIVDRLRGTQVAILNGILEPGRLSRVIDNSAKNGDDAYSLSNLFSDLHKGVWSELQSGANADTYRRNLQRAYIDRMGYLINKQDAPAVAAFPGMPSGPRFDASTSDIRPLARKELKNLAAEIRGSLAKFSNPVVKAHFEDALVSIQNVLDPK